MTKEILIAIQGSRGNDGSNSSSGLIASFTLEFFIADTRDNAATLFMPPVRPEHIKRHLIEAYQGPDLSENIAVHRTPRMCDGHAFWRINKSRDECSGGRNL